MNNVFNFVERFAPLSNLQGTVVEFNNGKFIIAPEGMISCNLQDDHVVVWYKNPGEDLPPLRPVGRFLVLPAGSGCPPAD